MIRMQATTEGLQEAVGEEVKATLGLVKRMVSKAGDILVKHRKAILRRPGTGRIYTRGGRTHVASAPGQPPAKMVGFLSGSQGRSMTKRIRDGWETEVGTGLGAGASQRGRALARGLGDPRVYGDFLDRGGMAGRSRILARPWKEPAEREAQPEINRAWAAILDDER